MTDPFDSLVADTTPVSPSARFTAELRTRLINALEIPMSDTANPVTANPVTANPVTANTVTPYLCVNGAAAAIDFYVAAFGAVEHHRMVGDDGRIGHAEISIGTSRLMLADEYPEVGVLSPTTRGGSSTNFTLDVPDVDAAFATALGLGATELRAVDDQFYGFRQGTLVDPFGHQWSLSTPIAGFGDDDYTANSAEQGFEVRRPAASASVAGDTVTGDTVTGDTVTGDDQLKAHRLGDLYYFTLPVDDLTAAQSFFGAVLGWRFDDPGNGHVGSITAPPGGLAVGTDTGARLWFVVDDIHAAVARVREHGGSADEPVDYDSGWSADCIDDQGTVFSLSVPAAKYTR